MIRMMGAIVESIQDAPDVVMTPRREPTALGEVRDLIAEARSLGGTVGSRVTLSNQGSH